MLSRVLSCCVPRIVVDTDVFVASLLSDGGLARQIVRACLTRAYQPIIGEALFLEYEDVMAREDLFARSKTTETERSVVFDALLSVCEWVPVYYLWRPNLRDEADNHLLEIAVAGAADAIVSRNQRDLTSGELRFPSVRILNPKQCLEVWPCQL